MRRSRVVVVQLVAAMACLLLASASGAAPERRVYGFDIAAAIGSDVYVVAGEIFATSVGSTDFKDVKQGTIVVKLIEVIRGNTLTNPQLEVGFWQRLDPGLRPTWDENPWEGVDLKNGSLLLLFLTTGNLQSRGGPYQAVGVVPLTSRGDPELTWIRQAVEVEAIRDPGAKLKALTKIFGRDRGPVRLYALNALARQPRWRREAARAFSTAFLDQRENLVFRINVAARLQSLFDPAARDATNTRIVVTFFEGLKAGVQDIRRYSVTALHAALLPPRPDGADVQAQPRDLAGIGVAGERQILESLDLLTRDRDRRVGRWAAALKKLLAEQQAAPRHAGS